MELSVMGMLAFEVGKSRRVLPAGYGCVEARA
jgi:hypothetical protein